MSTTPGPVHRGAVLVDEEMTTMASSSSPSPPTATPGGGEGNGGENQPQQRPVSATGNNGAAPNTSEPQSELARLTNSDPRVSTFVMDRPPMRRSAVMLDREFSNPLVPNFRGWCSLRSLFCTRCGVAQQWDAYVRRSDGDELLSMDTWSVLFFTSVLDLLTGGWLPCGFYHGLGTAGFGCWTRLQVRHRYRVMSYGAFDFCAMLVFPSCAVTQQWMEIEAHDVVPPAPCELS